MAQRPILPLPRSITATHLTDFDQVHRFLTQLLKSHDGAHTGSLDDLEACLRILRETKEIKLYQFTQCLSCLAELVNKGSFIDIISNHSKDKGKGKGKDSQPKAILLCLRYMGAISANLDQHVTGLVNSGRAARIENTAILNIMFAYSRLGVIPPESMVGNLPNIVCTRLRQEQNNPALNKAFVSIMIATGHLNLAIPPSLIAYLCGNSFRKQDIHVFLSDSRQAPRMIYEIARLHNRLNGDPSDANAQKLILLLEQLIDNPKTPTLLHTYEQQGDIKNTTMLLDAAAYLAFVTGKENNLENFRLNANNQASSLTERLIAGALEKLDAQILPVLTTKSGTSAIDFHVRFPYCDKTIALEFDGPAHFCFSYTPTGIVAHLDGKTIFQSTNIRYELTAAFHRASGAPARQDLPRILVRLPITAIMDDQGRLDSDRLTTVMCNIFEYMQPMPADAPFETITIDTAGQIIPIHEPVARLPSLSPESHQGGLRRSWLSTVLHSSSSGQGSPPRSTLAIPPLSGRTPADETLLDRRGNPVRVIIRPQRRGSGSTATWNL
ncbi:MAG: hypothetical protein JNK24_08005 [Alphaproteobacteria bacterium]|nr:hypothetical protein [Alphaproteobacteria bacterium]